MEYVITDLDSVCRDCGYFNLETNVNNGYGCSHPQNEDPELVKKVNGDFHRIYQPAYFDSPERIVLAKSFTKINIKCNRRLAKKFLRKAMKLSDEERERILNSKGYYYQGECFDYACPIATSLEYDSLKNYDNYEDYAHIESQEEMPYGWGGDLMGIEKAEADKLGITY